MAWEQKHLGCAGRKLEFLAGSSKGEASQQAAIRQAVADADRDTVQRHYGLDVVMEKIVQLEQENPASNGRAMIDDFRLRGSRTWRRRGGPLIDGGGST